MFDKFEKTLKSLGYRQSRSLAYLFSGTGAFYVRDESSYRGDGRIIFNSGHVTFTLTCHGKIRYSNAVMRTSDYIDDDIDIFDISTIIILYGKN